MKHQKHPAQTVAAKQQTLNFGVKSLWRQLPAIDRKACRDAIAELIYQVADATCTEQQQPHQENNEHER